MPADTPGPLVSVRAELRELDVSVGALRRFGWVVGGVLAAGAALWAWRHGWAWGPVSTTVAGFGAALVALGTFAPRALRAVYVGWMALAFALGWLMTRLILTLVWLVAFVPIGLLFKATGRDALHRRPDPSAKTYWHAREATGSPKERMEQMF